MNFKGQLDIPMVALVALILGIILAAPILMKIVDTTLTNVDTSFQNSSFINEGNEISLVKTKFMGLFDTLVIAVFLILVVLLLISAYLVDISPGFLILYVVSLAFLFLLTPDMLGALSKLWESDAYASYQTQLPMTLFILNNFYIIMLGIAIFSGIIMYVKFKSSGSGGGL